MRKFLSSLLFAGLALCASAQVVIPDTIISAGSVSGSGGGGSGTVSSGTTNVLAKYTGTTTVGNSLVTDNGTTLVYTGTGGIISPIFSSNNADPADAGVIRLGNAELIEWEANPTGTDLTFGLNSSNLFAFTAGITTTGTIQAGSGATTAGAIVLAQGTTQSTGTTNITIQAPTAVTSYLMTLPGAAATGLYLGTNSAGTVTLTQVALGTGVQTFLTTPSSANFFSAITDENGSGVVVGSASPTFTGSPLAPTQTAADNSTKISTTGYADRDSTLTYNAQTGTTYTLVLADGNPGSTTSGVSMANASAMTLTVPTNASVAFPVGWTIPVLNLGAGSLTLAAAGGVTLNAPNLTLGVNVAGVLHKTATNTWQFYGQGLPAVVAHGDKTGQTAAVTITSFTVGAADAEFIVSTNVLVTTSTTYAFTVTCAYTDEGNTARTLTFNLSNVGGTFGTSVANAGGAVPYEGVPLDIRCKTGTTITIATAAGGTYTAVTYNARGTISQIN